MGNEDVELVTVAKPTSKKSLLDRYDIPIEHLSYEHINRSTDVKELERIVLIFRSGEEGVYPDLTKHAEARLAQIKPESSVLRIAEPVATRETLAPERRRELENDLNHWMSEMKLREKDLQEGRSLHIEQPIPQPDVRRITLNEPKKQQKSSEIRDKSKRISSFDYAAWDKYDADTELNRIDLQQEKRKAEVKRTQQKLREKEKIKKTSREAMVNNLSLTGTEFNVMAEEERKKGNEAFRAGDYEEALQFYDLSIGIDATIQAHNNRAITYIKLRRYDDAVNDCNRVIVAEHANVKALLRRGLALEHLEKKAQALADYEAVLKLEPTNKIAIAAVKKLRSPCTSRKIKMKITEEADEDVERKNSSQVNSKSGQERYTQISNTGNSLASRESKSFDAVQKMFRPPEVCFCDNAPCSSRQESPLPHMRNVYCSRATEKSSEPRRLQSIFTNRRTSRDESSGVIIEEIPNDPIEEKTVERIFAKTAKPKKAGEKNLGSGDAARNTSENPVKLLEEIPEMKTSLKEVKNEISVKPVKFVEEIPEKKLNNRENIIDGKMFENISTPYEFIKIWHSLKNDSELILRAGLLLSLTPENIDGVIGNKLDGEMLSAILRCFERHFCVPDRATLLHRFLRSLTGVKRFSMICMFMDERDKEALRNILAFLEAEGSPVQLQEIHDLRKAYGTSV